MWSDELLPVVDGSSQSVRNIIALPFNLSDYSSRSQFRSSFVKFVVAMLRNSRSIMFLGGVASYVTNHFSRSHRIKALLPLYERDT